jgi:hypothetical protein
MMKKREINFLIEQGLHDAVIDNINIDFRGKVITLCILTRNEKIELVLKEIGLLHIEKDNDFRNDEIILTYSIVGNNEISFYTTSNTKYRICFKESIVLIDKK